ncbi:MAG TPA: glycosyltransferase family 39 protein [Acidobacteriaceae bacterium]|jgi:4-amino-4-deoxy-L-arabinose transferase-like glycosyltransferase|nr:glycosyltransferase family 39 protein [Acidobacteriaceae bacterium]
MHLFFLRARKHLLIALGIGLVLRLWFIHAYPVIAGDSLIYGDIAKNWFWHGVYGLTVEGGFQPTLIRLPGYPLFLAACFRLFGMEHYNAVLFAQTAIDLGACLLVAAFAAHCISLRAGIVALYLAALCPFTANYVATPLTETLSVFCIALGLYAFARYVEHPGFNRWFFALAFAISYAALLRPDGALLGVVLLPGMFWFTRRHLAPSRAFRLAVLCAVLTLLPFVPWTLRNARTLHVFQPLAPRSAMDPGEYVDNGWNQWVRTWCVEFTSTYEIYWNVPGAAVDVNNLPSRAFDTPAERARTAALFNAYDITLDLTPEMDTQFAQLARERIQRHPVQYYVVLPVLRLADMWLRPRTEMLWIEPRWWQFQHHEAETVFAWSYAALNLAYLLAAVWGMTKRVPYASLMLLYVVLRCLLLLTLEYPEQRYTLECFPMIFILAAAALAVRRNSELTSAPQSSSMSS